MFHLDVNCPEMSGENFRQLLDLCIKKCDYFSLTISQFDSESCDMQTQLSPFIYKEVTAIHWFRYTTPPNETVIKRLLYPINASTVAILNKYCQTLFLRDWPTRLDFSKADLLDIKPFKDNWNQTLEDLCFFLNGKLVLGTVSHEYLCDVYPPDAEFEAKLFGIYSHWGEVTDLSQQIDTDGNLL